MAKSETQLQSKLAKIEFGDKRYSDIRIEEGLYLRVYPPKKGSNERYGSTKWNLSGRVTREVEVKDPDTGLVHIESRKVPSTIGLGDYPDISLLEARTRTLRAKDAMDRGEDPKELFKKGPEAVTEFLDPNSTFKDVALNYHANKVVGVLKNQKNVALWLTTMRPFIDGFGHKRMRDVTPLDIVNVMRPIWETKYPTAKKVGIRIDQLFNFARGAGIVDPLTAAPMSAVKAVLPKPKHVEKNHASLPYKDVPQFYADLCARSEMTAWLMRWIILTGGRSNEARGARWSEFNFDERVWTVPFERVKQAKKEDETHIVFLDDVMLEFLVELGRIDDTDLLFPNSQLKPMSDAALIPLIKRMGYTEIGKTGRIKASITTHGFRTSLRTFVEEFSDIDTRFVEQKIGHKTGTEVERRYRRDAVRRHVMLQLSNQWTRFVTGMVKLEDLQAELDSLIEQTPI